MPRADAVDAAETAVVDAVQKQSKDQPPKKDGHIKFAEPEPSS